MTSAIERKIEEILDISFFDMSQYKEVVEEIVSNIYRTECVIFLAHIPESKYIPKNSHGYMSNTIRMGLLEKKNGLEFLWTLFHEFGHHHDELFDKKKIEDWEYRYHRELKAWNWAETQMSKFEILKCHSIDYITYKSYCLSTYVKKINT